MLYLLTLQSLAKEGLTKADSERYGGFFRFRFWHHRMQDTVVLENRLPTQYFLSAGSPIGKVNSTIKNRELSVTSQIHCYHDKGEIYNVRIVVYKIKLRISNL